MERISMNTIWRNDFLRKTVLAVAGLTFTGAVVAGAPAAAMATPDTPKTEPVAMELVAQKSSVDKPKPDRDKLIPHGVQGEQSHIRLTPKKVANAKKIIAATKKSHMDERAAVVAIATSMQESKLVNLGHLGDSNDHDSQGLFQQRPSAGWGTVDQVTNPTYSTKAFLRALKQVDGWRSMPLTDAAQAVQVSAYPDAYAQWESQAADIVANHWNS